MSLVLIKTPSGIEGANRTLRLLEFAHSFLSGYSVYNVTRNFFLGPVSAQDSLNIRL